MRRSRTKRSSKPSTTVLNFEFDKVHPGEMVVVALFNHLRPERKIVTYSIWRANTNLFEIHITITD